MKLRMILVAVLMVTTSGCATAVRAATKYRVIAQLWQGAERHAKR